ncbi:MAG: bifunctional (p)ppGpp synthetase/guanosine-3',5'-bis(diphosphate) 3'-pyrophosphohydrolase [Acidobacteria bacterium]|nr:MAG: bifunctional (p)ppGpp synthetase/guanosine-3',5'-bis(diphosphate) 3'-pyrophosphohydrolase [Acidobacteriota bacterium]REK04013.1 MAG: bifunctional (p)ppGpp synthetase/guanosine-3',5'-bis(diphosphate) 3'-pyrophosphohydrolase [Acidobacteriota bacterium]REK15175.1 MAG: bifunctional (p)ppGpp synthetase/guanosine-3',5'-bis(diphosphate) 3'-pyrophosphohydrolase [Acidobacteriota bacterium]REK46265.1 MAG: bifunctional (p)ppGpp synthetase/guanosine-3',5'-bis(diphosphate) 3'-pyrophosphohydrolase [Ac
MNSDLEALLKAAHYAARQHKDQKRKGANAEPYIVHPLEVAKLLSTIGGVDDPDVLIAAILHDTIEDTDASENDIAKIFGERVCSIVMEVTDDKSLPKQRRKELQEEHAPHLSHEAKQLKMCDKISNISDIVSNPPADWDLERKLEYVEWGERVFAGLRGANGKLEKHFDELVERAKRDLI